MAKVPTETALRIAAETESSYSFDAFGMTEWALTIDYLLRRGVSEEDAAFVMRSKHTRWSRDYASQYAGTAKDFAVYWEAMTPQDRANAVTSSRF